MDNQETLTQNFELPNPTGDASAKPGESAPEQGASHEQQSAPGASAGPAPSTASPIPGIDPAKLGITTAAPAGASTHSAGLSADDADLIEKEWVLKAKLIVAQTHGDPYTQNNEINKIKADYIKKRYNKDIRLTSE